MNVWFAFAFTPASISSEAKVWRHVSLAMGHGAIAQRGMPIGLLIQLPVSDQIRLLTDSGSPLT